VGAFRKVLLLRHVVVNLTDGTSISGVMYRDPGNLIVLKNATYFEPGAEPAPLDGDTVIERTKVLFVQAP
jgi:hypothetical protein